MAKPKTKGVSAAVYDYFLKNRNVEVHAEDVADAVDLTPLQVMSAVSHIRNKWGATIDSPRKGWYIFRGTPQSTGDIVPHKAKAEVIALVGDGRLLVSVEGVVYVATALDLGE